MNRRFQTMLKMGRTRDQFFLDPYLSPQLMQQKLFSSESVQRAKFNVLLPRDPLSPAILTSGTSGSKTGHRVYAFHVIGNLFRSISKKNLARYNERLPSNPPKTEGHQNHEVSRVARTENGIKMAAGSDTSAQIKRERGKVLQAESSSTH